MIDKKKNQVIVFLQLKPYKKISNSKYRSELKKTFKITATIPSWIPIF